MNSYYRCVSPVTCKRFGLQQYSQNVYEERVARFYFLNSCRKSEYGSLTADTCVCSWIGIIKTQVVLEGNNSWFCCLTVHNTTGRVT